MNVFYGMLYAMFANTFQLLQPLCRINICKSRDNVYVSPCLLNNIQQHLIKGKVTFSSSK